MLGFYACAVEPRNPGYAGVGIVIAEDDGKIIKTDSKYLGEKMSVWLAAFQGLLFLTNTAVEMNIKEFHIHASNTRVVQQISGHRAIHDPQQFAVAQQILVELSFFDKVSIQKLDRAKNTACVELAENAVRPYSKDKANPYFSVTHGGVQFRRVDKYTYRVIGSEDYYVNIKTKECTCSAYHFHPERPCKHILAIQSYERQRKVT